MTIARNPVVTPEAFEPFDALTPDHLATVTELRPEPLSPDVAKLSEVMVAISTGVEGATAAQQGAASKFDAHTTGLERNASELELRKTRLAQIVEQRQYLETSIAKGEQLFKGGSRTVEVYESRVAELTENRATVLHEKVAKDLELESHTAIANGDDPEITPEQRMESTYIVHGLDPKDATPDRNSLRAQVGELQRDITTIDQELRDLTEDQIPKLKATIKLCLTRLQQDRATYKQLGIEFARLNDECRSFLARVALDEAYFDSIIEKDSAIAWTTRPSAASPQNG